MTNSEPRGDGPIGPPPAFSAQPTTAPGYGPVPPAPPTSKRPAGLAIAALVIGIAAFLFGLIPVFGAIVGAVAVLLAVLALRRKQSKGMAIAGIILGGIAVLSSVGTTIGIGSASSDSASREPASIVAETSAPPVDPEAEASASAEAEAEASASASAKAEADAAAAAAQAAAAAEAAIPADHKSALTKAEMYSSIMHMSKAGIYDQLTSEYGEQFSAEAAQYAVDNVQADWNANALAKAKEYQQDMAMSPEGIRDQLTSSYGEKFTADEAAYAIAHLND